MQVKQNLDHFHQQFVQWTKTKEKSTSSKLFTRFTFFRNITGLDRGLNRKFEVQIFFPDKPRQRSRIVGIPTIHSFDHLQFLTKQTMIRADW